MAVEQLREVSDGTLQVRVRADELKQTVCLCGELDLANAGTAELELDAAMGGGGRLVVDLRELEFIDSTGIAILVRLMRESNGSGRLGFLPSPFPAVTRVLEVTGIAARMPQAEAPLAAPTTSVSAPFSAALGA